MKDWEKTSIKGQILWCLTLTNKRASTDVRADLNKECIIKVTGNALNIEYYFWWRDYCFGLLIHDDDPFHFMVSISDEYKYEQLVKTPFKSCGKPIFLEIYHTRN